MGPLAGLKVLEFAGLGPGPFCAMLLADLGAEMLRIDRVDAPAGNRAEVLKRGRRSVAIDLKSPAGIAAALRLVDGADALIEGFRPGVMERMGLGPESCLARNPRLAYGRMTGWGQDGPLAPTAGHDINYIALTGALWATGRADAPPAPPLNLVGDFGGGGMLLAVGLLSAILHARATGRGQVVDAAMTDGSALLMGMFHGMLASGRWRNTREANLLDGAAPFYDSYRCADGRYVAVGAIEPAFFAALLRGLGLDPARFADRMDPARWPALKEQIATVFLTRGRDDWEAAFAGSDACVTPVLDLGEAPAHAHNAARGTYVTADGVTQPAPAPRFSATPAGLGLPPPLAGEHTDAALADWGFAAGEIAELHQAGAIRAHREGDR
jgi:alpha-methylacyl-CoA racemase